MSPLPRPAQDPQTLLNIIKADRTNETVQSLCDQLDEAERLLATSLATVNAESAQGARSTLKWVFGRARDILDKARK